MSDILWVEWLEEGCRRPVLGVWGDTSRRGALERSAEPFSGPSGVCVRQIKATPPNVARPYGGGRQGDPAPRCQRAAAGNPGEDFTALITFLPASHLSASVASQVVWPAGRPVTADSAPVRTCTLLEFSLPRVVTRAGNLSRPFLCGGH